MMASGEGEGLAQDRITRLY